MLFYEGLKNILHDFCNFQALRLSLGLELSLSVSFVFIFIKSDMRNEGEDKSWDCKKKNIFFTFL